MKKTGFLLAAIFNGAVLFATGGVFPEISGWKLQVDKAVFTSDNLWEVIDGAAELYLAYHFQDLQQAIYAAGDEREVKVELYRHDTPVNTYGIYTAERMPDYSFIETGTQGYTSVDILNFFTGCYYVKISSYGKAPVEEGTLKEIAARVSQSLNQTDSWPAEVGFFPEEGKAFMSDGYVASDFMGYGFLRSAFTARYGSDGESTLFIIHGKAGEAATMFGSYKKSVKEENMKQKGDVYVISDPYNGNVFLSVEGDYLVGVLNAGDEAAAMEYIGKVVGNIRRSDK